MSSPRHQLLGLAGIGLAVGLMHLPLSAEVGVTASFQSGGIRTLVGMLYPIAMSLSGLGAVLAMKVPFFARPAALRVAGAALLVELLLALRATFLTGSAWQAALFGALHVLAVGTWYLSLGAGLTALLHRIDGDETTRPRRLGHAWSAHLGGLVLGYAASEPVIEWAGANAALASAGISLLVLPSASPLLLVGLLIAATSLGLDERIERFRDLRGSLTEGELNHKEAIFRWLRGVEASRVVLRWSRFGQGQILRLRDGERMRVLYNLQPQYQYDEEREGRVHNARTQMRSVIYGQFRPEQRIMLIGVGAGRSLKHLWYEPNRNVIAVERDPLAAYFVGEGASLNDHVLQKADVRIADGRFVVETVDGCLHAVVLESAHFHGTQALRPVNAPFFLYTREAIDTYLDKLCADGVLVMEFSRIRDTKHRSYLAKWSARALADSGVPRVLMRYGNGHSVLLAARTSSSLRPFVASAEAAGIRRLRVDWNRDDEFRHYALTDDSPFHPWASTGALRRSKQIVAAVLFVLGIGVLVVWVARRTRAGPWNATYWFFLLGIAHAALHLHAFLAWRTYFGDDVRTLMVLIVGWLIYGVLGALCVSRWSAWLQVRARLTAVTTFLLALHFVATALLPFEAAEATRVAYAALALVPGGLLLGAFMPFGLGLASKEGLATWLAADALGSLAAAALVYCVMIPLGVSAFGLLVVASYAALAMGAAGASRR